MNDSRPLLILRTERTGARFVYDALGATQATLRMVPADASLEQLHTHAEAIAAWKNEHPHGGVASLGDIPSLAHALAGQREPSVTGAGLRATLACLDKAWCRQRVTHDLGQLKTTVLRTGDDHVPRPGGPTPLGVMVKPIGGCASIGIVHTQPGEPAPPIAAPSGPIDALCRAYLGENEAGVVAVVEEYVSPDVPRVSVDGWVNGDGQPIPFAVSDNIYIDGEPERFDHQMLPTRLSAAAEAACWTLYRAVVERLAADYDLRDQFCDVEMFVFDADTDAPRAEVMEVNCRVHPNISPIFRRCLDGGDVLGAHLTPPQAAPTRRDLAGGLFYLWSAPGDDAGRPDPDAVARLEAENDVLACVFDDAGPKSNGWTCWGWLYVFADSADGVRALGERARTALMG
ncbi:MAG: hypothetical protein AAFV53_22260 [Myxococcota bacterium]